MPDNLPPSSSVPSDVARLVQGFEADGEDSGAFLNDYLSVVLDDAIKRVVSTESNDISPELKDLVLRDEEAVKRIIEEAFRSVYHAHAES